MPGDKVTSAAIITVLSTAAIKDWNSLSEQMAEVTVKIPAALLSIITKAFGADGFDKMVESGLRYMFLETAENLFKHDFKNADQFFHYHGELLKEEKKYYDTNTVKI